MNPVTWTQPTLPGMEAFAPADLCGGASLCASCPSAKECHPSTDEADPMTLDETLHALDVLQ